MKEKFLQSKIARETYRCQSKAFIDKSMRTELNTMIMILSNPDKYGLKIPIAHVVNRESDFISHGDACLEAGGDYSQGLF